MRTFFGRKRKKDDDSGRPEDEEVEAEVAIDQETSDPEKTLAGAPAFQDEIVLDQELIEEGTRVEELDISDLTRPMRSPLIEQTAVTERPKRHESRPKAEQAPYQGLRAVQRCDVGRIRTRNEDSTYIFTAEAGGQEPMVPFGLYIVADGMGGHHAGHKASRNVSRIVAQDVLERIYAPMIAASIGKSGGGREPINEVMLNAVQKANDRIHTNEPEKESGTTLTAAMIIGRRLHLVHVGDSRAYLLADGEFTQITTDHSYIQRLQDAGQLTEEEAAVHPQRNVLYRAVGTGSDLEVDSYTRSLPEHGLLMICSDGLWGLVPNEWIQRILGQQAGLRQKAAELVEMALTAGGHDNVSVVLVEFTL